MLQAGYKLTSGFCKTGRCPPPTPANRSFAASLFITLKKNFDTKQSFVFYHWTNENDRKYLPEAE